MKKTSSKIKTSPQEKFLHVLNVFFLLIAVFLCVYPFYYMVIYSLSDSTRASLEGIYFLPKGFTLDAYKMILKKSGFGHAFLISGARTVIQTILCLFGSSLFAYLVTKKDMIGRKFVYRFVVITMYLSAGLVPYYMVLKGIHMLNTFWVFIFPMMMSVYNMILIRSYIESMPDSLFEAAKIDGANDLVVLLRIDAYLYTSDQALKPMQSILVEILNQYQTGASTSQAMSNAKAGVTVTPDSIRMAATMVATLPIIMVYPFVQKYFVKGIMLGAVKG